MTAPDAEFQKRLLATFREEAEEHLGVMGTLLLELERAGSGRNPHSLSGFTGQPTA